MRGLIRWAAALLVALVALSARGAALAELDGDCVYTLCDESGAALTMRAGQMFEGDEYIAADNRHYRVISVDDAARTAVAEYLGEARPDAAALEAFMAVARAEAKSGGRKLICMYSTHSDESYVPDDGAASKWEGAGIYDVGSRLEEALEARGIDVVYSKETFLPHDADAYTRSRRVAEELLKKAPDALIDVHRDAVPAEQYETEVDGEDVSKVRLFVGRSNPNADANKAFAQQLKAEADEAYPGLVKDIFIGRGNYNQELYPHAILLEFGTHEIDKDKAMASTEYMADVLDRVLYGGGSGGSARRGASTGSAAKGIGWVALIAAVAAVVYAFAATGSGRGAARKLGRRLSEVTGGLMGEKPEDEGKR